MPFWAALPAIASAGASIYGAARARKDAKNANKNNPANAAMSYFQQNPQIARGMFEPYMQRGIQAEQSLPGMYSNLYNEYANAPDLYSNMEDLYWGPSAINVQNDKMTQDPQGYINDIQRGYTPSEGYKYKEKRLRDAARSAASSGGFAGTEYDQERQADMIRGLLGQDMQQFLENVTGAQRYGMGGMERALAGRERAQERKLLGRERALERSLSGRAGALGARAQSQEFGAQRGFDAANALAQALIGNQNQMGNTAGWGQAQSNINRQQAQASQAGNFGNLIQSLPQLIGAFRGMGR